MAGWKRNFSVGERHLHRDRDEIVAPFRETGGALEEIPANAMFHDRIAHAGAPIGWTVTIGLGASRDKPPRIRLHGFRAAGTN
jgi:hypothetical protein